MFAALKAKIRHWNNVRNKRRRAERSKLATFDCKLVVLAIMKNESMNIDEWVTHYISMGAEKIFLIDNGSTDDTVAKAQLWATKGIVELVEYPERHQQIAHYWAAFNFFNIRKKSEWLLIADLDEFWFCPSGKTISESLTGFTGFDVIYANWRMFGSSGLNKHPQSIRRGFTKSESGLAAHTERKYIVRTAIVTSPVTIGIHVINGGNSAKTVSDNENFHLNHYAIQSVEYFQKVKMHRGDASSVTSDHIRDMQYFEGYDAPCTNENHLLADLVARGTIQ